MNTARKLKRLIATTVYVSHTEDTESGQSKDSTYTAVRNFPKWAEVEMATESSTGTAS